MILPISDVVEVKSVSSTRQKVITLQSNLITEPSEKLGSEFSSSDQACHIKQLVLKLSEKVQITDKEEDRNDESFQECGMFTLEFISEGLSKRNIRTSEQMEKKSSGLKTTTYKKLEPHKVLFLYKFSQTVVPSPLDWFEWVRVIGYWFLDEGITHDDKDGKNSKRCKGILKYGEKNTEGLVKQEKKKWEPKPELVQFLETANNAGKKIVYIGFCSERGTSNAIEFIYRDLEYAKSLVKQRAQTIIQVTAKTPNPSLNGFAIVMTKSDSPYQVLSSGKQTKSKPHQSNSYSTYSGVRGRSFSENLVSESNSVQLVSDDIRSASTGVLPSSTKPIRARAIKTQKFVVLQNQPLATAPALNTTNYKPVTEQSPPPPPSSLFRVVKI
ncbi:expressed protein [Phakopsora pachyrhizi]|uniref:Expressed protein n=1 Tax=Phakopsora pachyrhizi TaxID=170000 RepID=A0AAV0BK01_PHAPC|nr:expressed protein [Phakopsora pachyrhizi]